jgi:hypothetical protein
MSEYKLYLSEKDAAQLKNSSCVVKFSSTKNVTYSVEIDLVVAEFKPDISKDILGKAIKKILKPADEAALKAELGL